MIHEASAPFESMSPKRPPRNMDRQAKHTPQRARGGSLSQPGRDDHDDEHDQDDHVKAHDDEEDEEDDDDHDDGETTTTTAAAATTTATTTTTTTLTRALSHNPGTVADGPKTGSRRLSRYSEEAP